MRLRACTGMMLLALAGCQGIPSIIRIEVDGSTLEFKKKEVLRENGTVPAESNGAGDVAPTP